MMASSLCFLPPAWPRRLPWVGGWFGAADGGGGRDDPASRPPARRAPWRGRAVVSALLGAHLALQVLLPLRHLLYPGDVLWTEQGFRFAWHVMLMEKDGVVDLRVHDAKSGRSWSVPATAYLTRDQARMTATQPDMILEVAHIAAADFRARGFGDVEVRADAFASLNGRPRARLVDAQVDLARIDDGLSPQAWILPRPVPAAFPAPPSVAERDLAPQDQNP